MLLLDDRLTTINLLYYKNLKGILVSQVTERWHNRLREWLQTSCLVHHSLSMLLIQMHEYPLDKPTENNKN